MGLQSTRPHGATPTPSPFPWNAMVLCWPALPNSASLLLRFSSLTRGGNSFPASGVFGPHPHLPSMSHHPMSQFVACSFWCSLSVPSGCSISTALRAPSAASACPRPSAPEPPNPRSTQQPLKSLAAPVPALDHEPDPSMIHPIPLCYLCRGLEVSYPLLSHPRPCRSSGRCVMEEA